MGAPRLVSTRRKRLGGQHLEGEPGDVLALVGDGGAQHPGPDHDDVRQHRPNASGSLAGRAATAVDDPLVAGLTQLARDWPLSSVGVAGISTAEIEIGAFFHHPSLRQLYVDRIIEKADATRLDDPMVLEAVREAVGDLSHLAPRLDLEKPRQASAAPATK